MERGTFLDPSVQTQLGELAAVKIDIDDPANAAVCQQHGGGVPSFVMVTWDGDVVHRWVGAGDVAEFLADVQRGLANAADDVPAKVGGVLERLQPAFDRHDDAAVAACLLELAQLRPHQPAPDLDAALWESCTRAREHQNWSALGTAARRYVKQGDRPHHEVARVLLDIAEFELAGTITTGLQQHIDGLIAAMEQPFPGSTVGDRLRRLLGKQQHPAEAAVDAWVDRANETMKALGSLGRVAAPSLRRALLTRPMSSKDAAIVLARLRLPTTTEQLRQDLLDPKLPEWARRNVVHCIGNHKEERCLALLLEHLSADHPANTRTAAAYGVREILCQTDGSDRTDVADALLSALESNHAALRCATLQTLLYMHAPLPFVDLVDLFDDRRALFGEFVIADNALWIVLNQLGMRLTDQAGVDVDRMCTPEIAAFVQQWLRDHADRLQWSTTLRRYVVVD